MTLIEVGEALSDEPVGPEGILGGEVEEPGDDSDIYSALAAERKAIMADFTNRLRGAPASAKHSIKQARKSALAAASHKAKAAMTGRKQWRKERKLRRPPTRARKSPARAAAK
jgi:hypothetical protein